jgi:DNA segregation ATPase FtsK/SpoIIIE, S-DNA-T family
MKASSFDPKKFPPINDHPLKISVGIFLILFTLLGFLNHAFVSGMISIVFGFIVGDLRFIGYVLILLYGIRLLLNQSFIRLKWSLTTLGIFLIFIATLGLLTIQDLQTYQIDTPITLTNFFTVFSTQFPSLTTLPPVFDQLAVGGGILGYLVIALLNLLNVYNFNTIMLITMLIIGIILSLEYIWLKLFASIAHSLETQQKERVYFKKITELKPKNLPQQIYSEIADDSGQITSYRSLFNAQSIIGLERVSFKKPTTKQSPISSINQTEQTLNPLPTTPTGPSYSAPDVPMFDAANKRLESPLFTHPKPVEKVVKPVVEDSLYQAYQKPSIELLTSRSNIQDYDFNESVTKNRIQILMQKFQALGVEADVVGYQIGPSVTSFDIQMHEGAQTQQVRKVIRDLGIALGGYNIYFKEIVPGKPVSILEVLNERPAMVGYKEMLMDLRSNDLLKHKLTIPFGRNMLGEVVSFTPKDMIHLLVAGSSGSGKTVFVHTFITSILMETTPEQAKILLIDPKKFELNQYKDVPHLICPIISDISEAKIALERLIEEMEERYQNFMDSQTSSLEQYNQYRLDHDLKPLPIIFSIIDEYNDLINTNPSVSDLVQRLAQKSRAAGIHLLLATQRPTTDIITGSIKNNLATIVALRVSKQVDSVTVLGHMGAEILGGNGDMYLVNPQFARYGEIRVQGAYISDDEIQRVTAFLRSKYLPDYYERFLNLVEKQNTYSSSLPEPIENEGANDPLYEVIKAAVMTMDYASMSWISRTYGTGYPRALKIFKQLQVDHIIDDSAESASNNNRGRKVLIRSNFPGEES